ncbi:hypothetical protein FSP39_012763, partial [Pinctada imbricata]
LCFLSAAVVTIKEEGRSRCRHKFRQLSRDVCREVFDVPEDNRVLMAYEKTQHTETHIGEISFQVADTNKQTPGIPFDDDYYHQITFLFVKQDFHGRGIGKDLVEKCLQIMRACSQRPVRVQSAEKAVGFFQKLGFELQGEPIESACGVRLFRFMYNMEYKFS